MYRRRRRGWRRDAVDGEPQASNQSCEEDQVLRRSTQVQRSTKTVRCQGRHRAVLSRQPRHVDQDQIIAGQVSYSSSASLLCCVRELLAATSTEHLNNCNCIDVLSCVVGWIRYLDESGRRKLMCMTLRLVLLPELSKSNVRYRHRHSSFTARYSAFWRVKLFTDWLLLVFRDFQNSAVKEM